MHMHTHQPLEARYLPSRMHGELTYLLTYLTYLLTYQPLEARYLPSRMHGERASQYARSAVKSVSQ